MSGLSKLGITLTSVFSLLLLALLAELLYLFWRRRQQFRRKSNRIEPAISSTPAILPTSTTIIGGASHHHHHHHHHSDDLFKLEGIYGPPSRVLFTIKEEDKEEEFIETELARDSNKLSSGVSLGDHFGSLHQFHPEVIIVMGDSDFDVEFETEPPFLTPCTSPPYYTPSPSPTREDNKVSIHNRY